MGTTSCRLFLVFFHGVPRFIWDFSKSSRNREGKKVISENISTWCMNVQELDVLFALRCETLQLKQCLYVNQSGSFLMAHLPVNR